MLSFKKYLGGSFKSTISTKTLLFDKFLEISKPMPPQAPVTIADFPLKWTVQNCSHLYDTGINLHITAQRAIPSYLMDPKIQELVGVQQINGLKVRSS